MTKNEFMAICVEKCIDPSLALENDEVIQAIKSNDVNLLVTVLDNQF
jgi:hypothetical protein